MSGAVSSPAGWEEPMLPKDQPSPRDLTTGTNSRTESPNRSLHVTWKQYSKRLSPTGEVLETSVEMVAFKPGLVPKLQAGPGKGSHPNPPAPLSSTQRGLGRVQDFVTNVSDRHCCLFLLLCVESSGCPQGRLPWQLPAKQLAPAPGTLNSGSLSSQARLL